MYDDAPGSWKSGVVGLLILVAFLLAGFKWGGGEDPKPVHVQLSCQHFPDGHYDCVQP